MSASIRRGSSAPDRPARTWCATPSAPARSLTYTFTPVGAPPPPPARYSCREVIECFLDLRREVAVVPRFVPDDAGRAGTHQRAGFEPHRPGKSGRARAVLAWIAVRPHLPRVLDRTAWRAAGEPADLYATRRASASHGSRGRKLIRWHVSEASCAPDAELPVALKVTLAVVDRIDEVPDAQQVTVRAARLEFAASTGRRPAPHPRCRCTAAHRGR